MSLDLHSISLLVLYFAVVFHESTASTHAPTYELCDVGADITSLQGSIIGKIGVNCTRVILAPTGFRIHITFQKNSNVLGSDLLFYDGGVFRTKYEDNEVGKITQGYTYTHDRSLTSASNALVLHMDKVDLQNDFNISFTMFQQSSSHCKCLPSFNGHVVCTLYNHLVPGQGDVLERRCKIKCDQGYHTWNIGLTSAYSDFPFKCILDHNKPGLGIWTKLYHSDRMEDSNAVTCSKAIPVVQYKLLANFEYIVSSCDQVDLNDLTTKVRNLLVQSTSLKTAGECFKHVDIDMNQNCTVDSLNMTCEIINNGTSALITLEINDQIGSFDNYTKGHLVSNQLYSIFKGNLTSSLEQFIPQNLPINKTNAFNLKINKPNFICSNNAAYTFYGGKVVCLNCSRHFYDDYLKHQNRQKCEMCPNGTRRDSNEESCVPGVKDYPQKSFDNCQHHCPTGMFFNTNSTLCEWCPYGTYQNLSGEINPVCHPCPNGKTTAFVGARNVSECIHLCSAGHYLDFLTCVKCPIGYFMPNTSNRFHKCYSCPMNETTYDTGAVSCVEKCNVGQYYNSSMNRCILCPNNTYQDAITIINNSISCTSCPLNTMTINTGAKSVSDCLKNCGKGEFVDIKRKTCSLCPLNTFQNETDHFRFRCIACDRFKKTSQKGTSSNSDCIYNCTLGEYFNQTSEKCQKCQMNTYQNIIGETKCIACPGNTITFTPGSVNCSHPCKYGQFLNKARRRCDLCLEGFYQNITNHTAETCVPCPIDNYSNKTGAEQCEKCPGKKITVSKATNNVEGCINPCQKGTYFDKLKNNCSPCLKGFYQNKTDHRLENCSLCPSMYPITVGTGAKSMEDCVGNCDSSPCLNGGVCTNIDYGYSCACQNFLQGKTCNIIIDSDKTDKFEASLRFTSIEWNKDLADHSSEEYIKLKEHVEGTIRESLADTKTFRTVTVLQFLPGSVVTNFEITYVTTTSNYSTPFDNLDAVVTSGNLGNLTTDKSSLKINTFTCNQPLGMEDGRIPSSAITSNASSFKSPLSNARLNSPLGWAPSTIDGDLNYLQVDFGQLVFVTGVATQGSSYNGGSWLKKYYLTYSNDGKDWWRYHSVLSGNNDVNTTVHSNLNGKYAMRYLRVHPYEFKGWISYRIEIYGCPILKGVPIPTHAPITDFAKYNTTSVYDDDDDDDSPNVGLIVGLVLAALIVILLIVIVVVWKMKKKRESYNSVKARSNNAMQLREK